MTWTQETGFYAEWVLRDDGKIVGMYWKSIDVPGKVCVLLCKKGGFDRVYFDTEAQARRAVEGCVETTEHKVLKALEALG